MIKIYENLPESYAALLHDLINETLKSQDTFSWALSGGNTPIRLFQELANNYKESIPWKQIHFFWGDERCVPPDHDDSNYYHACKNLLCHIEIPRDNIHRIKGEEDPDYEAIRYANVLDQVLSKTDGIPTLDLNMLGLGTDGHTASIFPGQEHLFGVEKWCAVAFHPESLQKRISLTGVILNQAKDIHIMASGNAKAAVIKAIVEGSQDYPASYLQPKNKMSWILDKDAAHLLND